MKHNLIIQMIILLGLLSVVPASVPISDVDRQARELAIELLEDKPVAIRIYDETGKYAIVEAKVHNLCIESEQLKQLYNNINESCAIVITSNDQKDSAVALVLGERVIINSYKTNYRKDLWSSILPPIRSIIFNDSMGEPIPNAKVNVYFQKKSDKNINYLLTEYTDEYGCIKNRYSNIYDWEIFFIVSHPDYGNAKVKLRNNFNSSKLDNNFQLPLVHKNSEAYLRSARGIVTDMNEIPVSGAEIICMTVKYPGNRRLSVVEPNIMNDYSSVISDENGGFAIYKNVSKDGIPILVPENSKYQLRIEAPEELNLMDFAGGLSIDTEQIIKLEPKLSVIPYFVFEDENGPVTNQEYLDSIDMEYKRKLNDTTIGKVGKYTTNFASNMDIQPGQYTASVKWDGKLYEYGTIEIDDNSPEIVYFKPFRITPIERTYSGRVVHALTGLPLEGVMVMKKIKSSDRKFRNIARNLNMNLDQLGPEIESYDEVFSIFEENEIPIDFSMSDKNGYYEIQWSEDISVTDAIISLKKNFLGIEQRLEYFNDKDKKREKYLPDSSGVVTLPDMKMYPAAILKIEPTLPEEAVANEIVMYWYTNINGAPYFTEDVLGIDDVTKGSLIFRKVDLAINKNQMIYIPADYETTIYIFVPVQSQWNPIKISNVFLKQGEVLNLGTQVMTPVSHITVQVVDSMGIGVEGIMVESRVNGPLHFGYKPAITDKEGFAILEVSENSKGRIFVLYDKQNISNIRQPSIPYEIDEKSQKNQIFTIQLADEILNQIRNP